MKKHSLLRSGIVGSLPLLALAAAVFAAMVFLGGEPVAHAQQAAQPPAENQQSWTVNCSAQGASGDLVCTMSQVLIARNTGQRVLAAIVFRDAEADGALKMRLGLPHGIQLPEGATIWIDSGERATHVISTADQNGSYANVTLDDALVAGLKSGQLLNVMVKAASGDEVIFQLSLKGFSAALDKI